MTRHSFLRLWGWPIRLGCISIFGLLAALLADGTWNVVSWIALGGVIAVTVRHLIYPNG
jgi:hypothetical protein